MDIIVKTVDDQTPKGLTTGFRLKLHCEDSNGQSFSVEAAILISKEVIERQIPLPNIVLHMLKKEGFAGGSDLFVDSRRVRLDELAAAEPTYPLTLTLGGPDALNQRVVDALANRQ
jgi:hypothetical protein